MAKKEGLPHSYAGRRRRIVVRVDEIDPEPATEPTEQPAEERQEERPPAPTKPRPDRWVPL
jgi:hypothetical protein